MEQRQEGQIQETPDEGSSPPTHTDAQKKSTSSDAGDMGEPPVDPKQQMQRKNASSEAGDMGDPLVDPKQQRQSDKTSGKSMKQTDRQTEETPSERKTTSRDAGDTKKLAADPKQQTERDKTSENSKKPADCSTDKTAGERHVQNVQAVSMSQEEWELIDNSKDFGPENDTGEQEPVDSNAGEESVGQNNPVEKPENDKGEQEPVDSNAGEESVGQNKPVEKPENDKGEQVPVDSSAGEESVGQNNPVEKPENDKGEQEPVDSNAGEESVGQNKPVENEIQSEKSVTPCEQSTRETGKKGHKTPKESEKPTDRSAEETQNESRHKTSKGKNCQKDRLQSRVERLKEQIETLEKENDNLKGELTSIKNSCGLESGGEMSAGQFIVSLQKEFEDVSKERDDLKQRLNSEEENLQMLSSTNEAMNDTVTSWKLEVERKTEALTVSTDKYESLEKTTDALMLELDSANKDLESLRKSNKVLEHKSDKERKQLDDLSAKISKRENELKQLKNEHKAVKDSHKEEVQRLKSSHENERKRLQKDVNSLKSEIDRLKNDNKRLKSFEEVYPRLTDDIKKYKNEIERMRPYEETYPALQSALRNQDKTLKNRQDTIRDLKNENSSLLEEKQSLLLRLSKLAGANLTYNNPNIADLSDDKRPTKLAEEFSELYDNEWTDAFEDVDIIDEEAKTAFMLGLLQRANQLCHDVSTKHTEDIQRSISSLTVSKSLQAPEELNNESIREENTQTNIQHEDKAEGKEHMSENGNVKSGVESESQYKDKTNETDVGDENIESSEDGLNAEIHDETSKIETNGRLNVEKDQTCISKSNKDDRSEDSKDEITESDSKETVKDIRDETTTDGTVSSGKYEINNSQKDEITVKTNGTVEDRDITSEVENGAIPEDKEIRIKKVEEDGKVKNDKDETNIQTNEISSRKRKGIHKSEQDDISSAKRDITGEGEIDESFEGGSDGTIGLHGGTAYYEINETHSTNTDRTQTDEKDGTDNSYEDGKPEDDTKIENDESTENKIGESKDEISNAKRDGAGVSDRDESFESGRDGTIEVLHDGTADQEKTETHSSNTERTQGDEQDGTDNSYEDRKPEGNMKSEKDGSTENKIEDSQNNENYKTGISKIEEQKDIEESEVKQASQYNRSTAHRDDDNAAIMVGANRMTISLERSTKMGGENTSDEQEETNKYDGITIVESSQAQERDQGETPEVNQEIINCKEDVVEQDLNTVQTFDAAVQTSEKNQTNGSDNNNPLILASDFKLLQKEQTKTIMDARKFFEIKLTEEMVKTGTDIVVQENGINAQEQESVVAYIKKCINICWSMYRHDQPVYVEIMNVTENTPFDTNKFKPYTKSGKYIDYIVWPALHLHEGGPLLSKGVAQGRKA